MDQSYLIFGHRGARYGLDVRAVSELVWLPELSPIEELPPYIIGAFNLRGRVVPVMDLGLRFGHARQPFAGSDHVIVLDAGESRVGVIAEELHDVSAIAQAAIDDARSYEGAGGHAQFVRGEARLDEGLVMLLDIAALLRGAPPGNALSARPPAAPAEEQSPRFGKLSAEDAEVFRTRARALAQAEETEEGHGVEAFAVIRLGGELFGLELDRVREFSHLRSVVPVPCCPPWILGNMNLRGDILTLLDIRPALDMPTGGTIGEVVVVRAGEALFGIPAAEIVDVVHLAPSDVAPVPVAANRADRAYCRGVATAGGRALAILDLQKILAARELQAAEEAQ